MVLPLGSDPKIWAILGVKVSGKLSGALGLDPIKPTAKIAQILGGKRTVAVSLASRFFAPKEMEVAQREET